MYFLLYRLSQEVGILRNPLYLLYAKSMHLIFYSEGSPASTYICLCLFVGLILDTLHPKMFTSIKNQNC